MSIVKIKDKTFKTSISKEEIQQRIREVAAKINEDMAGKNPLFLGVLNGAFIFAADLLRDVALFFWAVIAESNRVRMFAAMIRAESRRPASRLARNLGNI